MMILHAFPPLYDQPSLSPFVVKTMCLLEMAGVEWKADFDPANLSKAPQKKLPVLIDGGTVVQDSSLIQKHLEETGADFGADLSPADKAATHMLTRMAEEHLYFALICCRWARDESFANLRREGFADMPAPMRMILPHIVRRSLLGTVKRQGLGRKSEDELAARVGADLQAIEAVLAGKPFLFGERPTAADASVGAMLGALSSGPGRVPAELALKENEALMGYVGRVRETIYPKNLLP